MRRKNVSATVLSFVVLTSALLGLYTNCQSGFSVVTPSATAAGGSTPSQSTTITAPVGQNVIPLTLGGYGNEPMISLTICVPGTTNCATISNLLLDSGSTGVRIFASSLPSAIASALGSTNGECYSYGDNSVDWGGVVTADIQLGQETAAAMPIQITNPSFGDAGHQCFLDLQSIYQANGYISKGQACPTSVTVDQSYDSSSQYYGCPYFDSPSTYYNGIVGVNFLEQDCGADCVVQTGNQDYIQQYYSCTGATCTGGVMPLTGQVSNPVGFMPTDNNGIVLEFPNVPSPPGYATNLTGYLILGIGTQSNNTPSTVTELTADPNFEDSCPLSFQTMWGGSTICGFLDTGSVIFSLPNLTSGAIAVNSNTGIFDPASTQTFTATNIGLNGAQSQVQFSLSNYDSLTSSGTVPAGYVINNIGAADSSGPIDGQFDWGFPFFLGRTVYVGLENKTSSIGSGLYWAY